jgi:hypothetical protein
MLEETGYILEELILRDVVTHLEIGTDMNIVNTAEEVYPIIATKFILSL